MAKEDFDTRSGTTRLINWTTMRMGLKWKENRRQVQELLDVQLVGAGEKLGMELLRTQTLKWLHKKELKMHKGKVFPLPNALQILTSTWRGILDKSQPLWGMWEREAKEMTTDDGGILTTWLCSNMYNTCPDYCILTLRR